MKMTPAQRDAVNRHRERQSKKGLARMELSVPRQDRELLRSVASELRKGGFDADRMRMLLKSVVKGEDLIDFKAFLEMAPLEGVDLKRSKDTGWREIDW
jgi:hypothetical protein